MLGQEVLPVVGFQDNWKSGFCCWLVTCCGKSVLGWKRENTVHGRSDRYRMQIAGRLNLSSQTELVGFTTETQVDHLIEQNLSSATHHRNRQLRVQRHLHILGASLLLGHGLELLRQAKDRGLISFWLQVYFADWSWIFLVWWPVFCNFCFLV